MQAQDIMTRDVICVTADTTVATIARLLLEHRIKCVPVIDAERHVIGIVCEDDLFLKEKGIPFSAVKLPALFKQWVDPTQLEEIYSNASRYTAADVMTCQVYSVDAAADVGQVACLMAERDLKRVPVLRDDVLVGIIARADIIQMLARGKTDCSA